MQLGGAEGNRTPDQTFNKNNSDLAKRFASDFLGVAAPRSSATNALSETIYCRTCHGVAFRLVKLDMFIMDGNWETLIQTVKVVVRLLVESHRADHH
jgi:hypothetical protein